MLKRELIPIALSLQNKITVDKDAKDEDKFNDNFAKFQAELVVTKRVNSELCKRIVTMERKCRANSQYSRKECLEVVGIPRLGENNDRVIVKFIRRKGCKQIVKVKKALRDLIMDNLDLPIGRKIYINQSLCPYYRIFWSKARRLKNIDSIDNFYISSGTIKIRVTENSSPITITHLDDFKVHFPEIDLSPPTDASLYRVHNMLFSW